MVKPISINFSSMMTHDNIIVKSHQVHGVRIMPGVTFLDIICRGLQTQGFLLDQVVLRNLVFLKPIATDEEYDQEIQIAIEKNETTGNHGIIIGKSRKVKNGQILSPEWDINLQGELHIHSEQLSHQIDIPLLKSHAHRVSDMEEAYADERKVNIVHHDFMKIQGKVYHGDGYCLAELHLSETAQPYLNYFYYHPAFLDSATIVPSFLFFKDKPSSSGEERPELKPFIPMFIESFWSGGNLAGKCYVYIREKQTDFVPGRDVIYADIELYNESGQWVAVLKKMTYKEIRSKAAITKLQTTTETTKSHHRPVTESNKTQGLLERVEGSLKEPGGAGQAEIEQDLQRMAAGLLGKLPETIRVEVPFYEQGLDSNHLLQLVRELEARLGRQLYPTLLFEYTNIRELAAYLVKENLGVSKSPITMAPSATTVPGDVGIESLSPATDSVSFEEIEQDLQRMVAVFINKAPETIRVDVPFYEQGLDSNHLLQLVRELEARLGQQLYPTLLFEYTNIRELTAYLVKEYGYAFPGSRSGKSPKQNLEEKSTVLFAAPVWEASPCNVTGLYPPGNNLLIFDTGHHFQSMLKERFGNDGSTRITLVKPGTHFQVAGDESFEINPHQPGDYLHLIQALKEQGTWPRKMIYFWASAPYESCSEMITAQMEQGLFSLFYLHRAMLEEKIKDKITIMVVSQSTTGPTSPLFGAIGGFAKSAFLENPIFNVQLVEFIHSSHGTVKAEQMADAIRRECQTESSGVEEIQYRGGERWVKRLQEKKSEHEVLVPVKKSGVYLITGGMGGLGQIFAEYLTQREQVRLVLTGRSVLNEEQQQQLRELGDGGSQVHYIPADISQRPAVDDLIVEIKALFHEIHGVIHCAGVTRDAMILKKTLSEMEVVTAPKVYGTVHLDEALAVEPLDFFVMFSSTAALFGNVGQSDYAYANSFMDHYAHWREALRTAGQRSGKTYAINWPLWEQGGMRVDESSRRWIQSQTGMIPLRNPEGIRAFEQIFSLPDPQVLVVGGDTEKIRQVFLQSHSKNEDLVNLPATAVEQDQRDYVMRKCELESLEPVEIPSQDAEEPIAIIGLSGRYPMAPDIDTFWENLKSGKDCITEIPKERWDYRRYYDAEPGKEGKTYSKWGGFIDQVDCFDPLFFNISPREAEYMDPQERLFLEIVWQTLEDAGYTKTSLRKRKVGLFVGVMWSEYQLLGMERSEEMVAPMQAHASIANRVSYFFDFCGPSIALDTMCSSALTAIHLACDSIRKGESEVAIAGGVNLSIHPNKYLNLSRLRFTSSDGRCRSFGEGGDGYVPGEGVGAVLLKPLRKAMADGDQIYAVIKGSALNHGGTSSGYTVPSPISQANVISEALRRAQVDPRTISYIEAHGTGTSLGDPIEITGLTKAFQEYSDIDRDSRTQNQYCAIGSAKSNIGHLESAAGIAGLTKVILQMKHRQLVPSLHSGTMNAKIHFQQSPFYIQHELTPWKNPVIVENGNSKQYPLRAGISSFGAGGSNAHIILEEFTGPTRTSTAQMHRQIFVFSAKNKERLVAYAEEMVKYLQGSDRIGAPVDMAYTLQVGREAMEERLAVVATTLEELTCELQDFCAGKANIQHIYRENCGAAALKTHTSVGSTEDLWNNGELEKLARLWVSGADIEWERLHTGPKPPRISLPTYPFTRERYWIPETANRSNRNGGLTGLHPVLDYNNSTFKEQSFVKIFTGNEFYLKEHIIGADKVLPGVIYLEMARAAGKLANSGSPVRKLKDIIWAAPVVMGSSSREVAIYLYPNDMLADYEVVSYGLDQQKIIHAQGRISYQDDSNKDLVNMDIEGIKRRCTRHQSRRECYREFKSHGFQYGPSFQTIREIWGTETEALSYLELPDELAGSLAEFDWHPSLMDGALQTVSGLIRKQEEGDGGLYLPFALGELELILPLPAKYYAHVEMAQDAAEKSKIIKFHITLADEQGRILARMHDFALKAFADKQPGLLTESTLPIYYSTQWMEQEAELVTNTDLGMIVVFDDNEELAESLRQKALEVLVVKPGNGYRAIGRNRFEIDPQNRDDYRRLWEDLTQRNIIPTRIVYHWTGESLGPTLTASNELQRGIYGLMYLTQAIIDQKQADSIQLLYVYSAGTAGRPLQAAIGGFAKSLRLENPKFIYKSIELEVGRKPLKNWRTSLAEIILSEFQAGDDPTQVRYEDGLRYVNQFKEVAVDTEIVRDLPLKEHGVYLITGGAGGLGLIFASYLAGKVKAKLVLTGRSSLSPDKEQKLYELEALGAQVMYVATDVTKPDEVAELIRSIKARFGQLNGIIHSAGILRDSFILKKSREEMEEVLGPKVFGTINLDEATIQEKLDFFVLFSSTAAVLGNLGQCDYAYGNHFMDHYARWRSENQRSGKSLALNWPLWREGGMQIGEDLVRLMQQTMGLVPLETGRGLEAFEVGLKADVTQLMILEGDTAKIRAWGKPETQISSSSQAMVELPNLEDAGLRVKTEDFLKEILGREIKLSVDKISSRESLEKYGIDSVMVMSLTQELERDFGGLSKTLFFEYQNISELTGYFLKNHQQVLVEKLGGGGKLERKAHVQQITEPSTRTIKRSRFASDSGKIGNLAEEDIAIIGVSGRYPMAENLSEYWENLKSGRDCITEIPPDRWNWRDYQAGEPISKWGGFIPDVDKFDPLFFNISPREAAYLDPQERLFMETVWHTLEDSGYTREQLWSKKIGVFAGVMYAQYQLFGVEETLKGNQMALNSIHASIANRVSYFFNFHGPSISLDTMCSSSLTAIHLACESIRRGESELAIAGGVNAIIHPDKYIGLSQANFTSSDGRCRAFGEGGDGYVPGEGTGAILLKPLSKAIADGDQIYAVIKGSAVNHGGKTNGYTVPNPNAQGELIAEVFKKSGIDPRTISYIEAHGTGTALGDPIEITGLKKAFGEYTSDKQYCSIGSAKSNVGHLESAAGIAGVTKLLLQLKHKQLVPSLHSEVVNPNVNFQDSPFYVQRELAPWDQPLINIGGITRRYPRRAGISAFGAGGSNAHIILEEYENPIHAVAHETKERLFIFSARNEERLKAHIRNMIEFLDRTGAKNTLVTTDQFDLLDKLRQDLLRITTELLQISEAEVSATDEINEYGLDQIGLTNLAGRMSEILNLELSATLFSDYGSLDGVAQYLVGTYPAALRRLYHEPEGRVQLETGIEASISLEEIAFTLQRREVMEERLAIIASDIDELRDKLMGFLEDKTDIPGLFKSIPQSEGISRFLMDGEEGMEFVNQLFRNRKLAKLASVWVTGVDLDWKLLYSGSYPRRISLPLYPFKRERYWLDRRSHGKLGLVSGRIHPLIDKLQPELSLWSELVYQKTVQSSEPLTNHYQILGRTLLPGMSCLEMVYSAFNHTRGDRNFILADVSWRKPWVEGMATDVSIKITHDNQRFLFRVISNNNGHSTVHAQGEIQQIEKTSAIRQRISPEAVKGRCTRKMDRETLVEELNRTGLELGSYYQIIHEVYANDFEALGSIRLPEAFENEMEAYTLHPAMLEGCLPIIAAFFGGSPVAGHHPLLPFAIKAVEVLQPVRAQGYAYFQLIGDNCLNMAILDDSGQVCVKLHSLVVREITDHFEFHGQGEGFVISSGTPATEAVDGERKLVDVEQPGQAIAPALPATRSEDLRESARDYVQSLFAKILKISKNDINSRENFDKYGVDSIVGMEISKQLERDFGTLPVTILIEHPTIEKLSAYLVSHYGNVIEARVSMCAGPQDSEGIFTIPVNLSSGDSTGFQARGSDGKLTSQSVDPQIEIMAVSEQLVTEHNNYWKQIRSSDGGAPEKVDYLKEYLKLVGKERGQIAHMRVKTKNSARMEVVMAGEGRPVLLIPGFGMTAAQWTYQLTGLAQNHQVIVIHAPGVGFSEDNGDLSFIGFCRTYLEVLDELAIQYPIHVIGASWGGMVAQTFAREYPDRVASLILTCSLCQLHMTDQNELKDRVRKDFENINAHQYYHLLMESQITNPVAIKYAEQFPEDGLSTVGILPEISVPTLVITGKEDLGVDMQESQLIRTSIPDSQYYEMEGAGHFPMLTHHQQYNQKVLEYLARQE
nr:SDR family NAD(P)-dependent oxidoreductase [Paenibacillus sp. SDF0028]